MSIKLIVMDMDGTLLDSNKQMSQRTINKLIEIQEQGCKLVLASGRVKARLDEYAHQLRMDEFGGYLIEANGSCLYDYHTGKREIIREMTDDEVNEIFQFIKKEYPEHEVMLMADVNAYVNLPKGVKESSYFNTNNMESLKNREIIHFNDVSEVNEMIFKVCTYDEPEKLMAIADHVKQALGHKYWSGRTMPFWLEILPKEISKGNSLQRLMDEHNIDKKDVYAFGDGENDISMLTLVNGVAMANAIDSVKACCQYTTLSCDEDGIAVFLERLVV